MNQNTPQTPSQPNDTASHGRIRDGVDAVVGSASHAYESTVKHTGKAIDASRTTASDAARRAAQGIESSPLGILIGGIAVGAAIGALIPRSAREKELLAPLGARLGTTARAAVAAAKDAGRTELEARGLTKDAVRDQAKGLFQGVVKAASSAGAAAKTSASTDA
ncbi:MAG TPA: hypothetical protein VFQ57_01705 [Sphingomonas sp.]|nr:hypothetical protein [Sphingomonas sp.]